MKLNSRQTAAVKQTMQVEPLEEENPAMDSLRNAFGDHSFFVVSEGLFVLEPVNDPEMEGEPAEFIQVAAWTNDEKTALQAVPARKSNTVVDLQETGAEEAEDAEDGD